MSNLPKNLIVKIAEEVHSGLAVFVHKQTHELATYVADEGYLVPEDVDYQKVQQNPNDYFQIKAMDSNEAYSLREKFIETVTDKALQADLKSCLKSKYKFQNFKHHVRNSEYEQQWFDFEANAQIEYVQWQLKTLSSN